VNRGLLDFAIASTTRIGIDFSHRFSQIQEAVSKVHIFTFFR